MWAAACVSRDTASALLGLVGLAQLDSKLAALFDAFPPRRRAAEIDVDNSTPNHLNIHVLERDYDIKPRFSAFIGFVLHGYPHNDLRIVCARLRPFALKNFRLFNLSKQALHEYPS
jgi:hypothetical protein